MHQGALALVGVEEEAANWCRQRAASVSRPDREPLKMVAANRVRATTLGDLLANRWQTAPRSPPSMQEAGCWTRPELLVWCGAPRRNRTGDPILTMDREPTAVLAGVSAARATPYVRQLWGHFYPGDSSGGQAVNGAAGRLVGHQDAGTLGRPATRPRRPRARSSPRRRPRTPATPHPAAAAAAQPAALVPSCTQSSDLSAVCEIHTPTPSRQEVRRSTVRGSPVGWWC
jgi:hypothetical protein